MGYILDPSEVREWIEEVNTWLNQLEERYQSGLIVIKEFSESEDLEGKAYNKMKEDFLTYHTLAVHGATQAKESIQQDFMILNEAIGTEYLDEDLLDEQIDNQKKTCRHYEDVLDHLYHLSRIPFFDYYLEPLIESNRKLLELSEGILDRLKEKLERLYDIGNSTRFLFDNASDWLSAVSSAIEDLQVTITGEGNFSNGSWKGLLIPSFEEKVGRLENFKGGNEWNTFTIKEKINKLKEMIEETTDAMPKKRREWIENEIKKIIPSLTPKERETFKTAMKEHGLKYDEIGLGWDELTTEGRFRRLKRMIEKTTESMPKVRKERIEGKGKELFPFLSDDEKKELHTVMKVYGLEYDEGGSDAIEESGKEYSYVDIPQDERNLGTIMSYMGWHLVTSKTSPQYKLKEDAKNTDRYSISIPEYYAMVDSRIVIATKPNIGGMIEVSIGDYIDVTFQTKDGTILTYNCILGDIKGDDAPNTWGHYDGKGVVEIIYHDYNPPDGYNKNANNPWGSGNVLKITKVGNYYSDK